MKLNQTIYVPESMEFKTVDDALDALPEDPVSLLVSRYAYDLAVRALKEINDDGADGRFGCGCYYPAEVALKKLGEIE